MKKSVVKALIIIAFIVSAIGFMFMGLPWAVQTAFSIFGVSVSYVQAIALSTIVILIIEALKE